ncbi:dihydrofolate reductase family protein [Kribbella sp. NPDC055071]
MRKLVAAMKMSVDGKIEGPEGIADWVESWSDDYGLTSQIDTCLLGGGMYPGYEQYWTAIQDAPDALHPLTGKVPTRAEVEWGRFAAQTPHYVLSNKLTSAQWPKTRFIRGLDEVKVLKDQAGLDIYLMGGPVVTASLVDAGLVDELRLIVYPLVAGDGRALFATTDQRHGLELQNVEQLSDGRVSLVYGIA